MILIFSFWHIGGESDSKIKKKVVITNELGIHARPAAKIAELAQKAEAGIWMSNGQEEVDASSVLDILSLACLKGTEITLRADIHKDSKILNKIVVLAQKGFDE